MRRIPVADLAAEPVDLLVVGGGIHGAFVARDAGLRGLRVALVERGDFGAETSHNSMKVLHGGIRHVQHLDLAGLRAAAREQAFWAGAAGAYLRPLPFVMPLTGLGRRGPAAFAAAAGLYNLASLGARRRGHPGASVVGPARARALMGALAPADMAGGGIWTDMQIRDVGRLQLACIAAAADAGALVANHTEADLCLGRGRVVGARLRDRLTGAEAEVAAGMVVVAAGPATGDVVRTAAPAIPATRFPRFRRAMNLALMRPPPPRGVGMVSTERARGIAAQQGRLYFLTPWRERTILGTFEADIEDGASLYPPEREIASFLSEANSATPGLDLRMAEIGHVYSGLIPAGQTAATRRRGGAVIDHAAMGDPGGVISVIGAKYTAARLLAAEATDRAVAHLGAAGRSRSLETPLPVLEAGEVEADAADLAVRRAVRCELAATLSDVVMRRLALAETGALAGAVGASRLSRIADLLASELGWSAERKAAELCEVEAALGLAGATGGRESRPA